jgi:hypothetical protein
MKRSPTTRLPRPNSRRIVLFAMCTLALGLTLGGTSAAASSTPPTRPTPLGSTLATSASAVAAPGTGSGTSADGVNTQGWQRTDLVATPRSGTFIARWTIPQYPSIVWDWCQSGSGDYIYLEDPTASLCGNAGWGPLFSFSYVSFTVNGMNSLEVCQSGNHSGTTTLYDNDHAGSQQLSDSGGGGCALATRSGIASFRAGWGTALSPVFSRTV